MGKIKNRKRNRLRGKKLSPYVKKILSKTKMAPVKSNKKLKPKLFKKEFDISLGSYDSIHLVWKTDEKGTPVKVVCISYDLMYENKWYTIIRFDTEHGPLHCHMRQSIKDDKEVLTPGNWIKKTGTVEEQLNWARDYIYKHHMNHRRGFLKRSGIKGYY